MGVERLALLGCLTAMPLVSACQHANASSDDRQLLLTRAVAAEERGAYGLAASRAWQWMGQTDADDARYDRARLLLARSLEGLELSWSAGLMYRQIAQERRSQELVPEAVAGLQRLVERGAYDRDLLVTSFLAAEELRFLPDDQRAFVDYLHGLDLVRRGDLDLAAGYLGRIPDDSPYAARAAHLRAVHALSEGRVGDASSILEALDGDASLPDDLRAEVTLALARLAFDQGRYADALALYDELRDSAAEQPGLLLEMAWSSWYLGDSRRTLGLLVALDAPYVDDLVAPERYLLEVLALRRLCLFGAAGSAADRLEQRHGELFDALDAGVLPHELPELVAAARQRPSVADQAAQADRLHRERDQLARLGLDDDLVGYLDALYGRGATEAEVSLRAPLGWELDALTEELVSTREGVALTVHELGVAMLRGRRRPDGPMELPPVEVPLAGEAVSFAFTGEYWADELDDLVVVVEDRCLE